MANNPKLDFMMNVPTTIVLKKNFKNGDGEYGPWYGWNVMHDGVEKTVFADSSLQNYLATAQIGVPLVVIKGQIPGSKSFRWTVQPAGMAVPAPVAAPQAVFPPQPIPYVQSEAENGSNRDSYRAERIERAKEAVSDAEKVLDPELYTREDIRALAISFLIEEVKKGIAAPEGSPF